MLVLGVDSSALTASAALVDEGRVIASFSLTNKLTHSQTLLSIIDSLFTFSGIDKNAVELFAVSSGPGSFTGLRIGISTVKGLAFSRNVPCVGVSTLSALAYNLRDSECVICPVMDARRGEFYNALFKAENGEIKRLSDDRAISGTSLAGELAAFKKVIVNGDGADKFLEACKNDSFVKASSSALMQNAVSVTCLGEELYKKGSFVLPDMLMPEYLRLSQAERELNKK